MPSLLQSALLETFQCLGDACEDTCCQNWSMQVDDATLKHYRDHAPELLDAVEAEADGTHVMERDSTTRYCVKMEDGLCGIHKKYGDRMLGDACHFYPRITRKMGAQTVMTATPSCPEIVRLMLSLDTPFSLSPASIDRLPHTLKNYIAEGMHEDVAMAVHHAFLTCALDESITAEQALARISNVARSMHRLDPQSLDQSVPLYLRLADGHIPTALPHPADPFNLLHALCGLIVASHKPISDRLARSIADMEHSLKVTLDWQHVNIALSPESPAALADMQQAWKDAAAHYAHVLRRTLAMQLSLGLFPFAGLGSDAAERITFIGVRFATLKLALACAHHQHGTLQETEIIRIIQSLSRFLDHLGDSAFSLSIYHETGWDKENRLLALFQP